MKFGTNSSQSSESRLSFGDLKEFNQQIFKDAIDEEVDNQEISLAIKHAKIFGYTPNFKLNYYLKLRIQFLQNQQKNNQLYTKSNELQIKKLN